MKRLSRKLMTGLLSLISLLTFSATSIGSSNSAHAKSNQNATMTHQRKTKNHTNKKRRHRHGKHGHNPNQERKPTVTTHKGMRNTKQQVKGQQRPKLAKHVRKQATQRPTKSNWFKDGLSKQELSARNWISFHESGHRWNVLSYGGRCIGYFQLDPNYLGRKNGHVNLNHQHQVKVADAYAKSRYGSWQNAKRFWQSHHWY